MGIPQKPKRLASLHVYALSIKVQNVLDDDFGHKSRGFDFIRKSQVVQVLCVYLVQLECISIIHIYNIR